MRKFLIKVSGEQYEVEVEEMRNGQAVAVAPKVITPTGGKVVANTPCPEVHKGGCRIDSPMPGSILKLKVKVGDEVKKGQGVFTLEAMKMENEITSPINGKVGQVLVGVGDAVAVGQTIIVID